MIRKTVFWLHLSCGVAAGLVILMMSATGVLLTYERQVLDWADHTRYAVPATDEARLPIAALVDATEFAEPGFAATSVTFEDDATVPVAVGAGRSGVRYVNPYTAEVLGEGATGLREFFSAVTGWHRWFNASGENRGPWRTVTGASNLAFLFLILSGLYLWLPRVFRWALFRTRLWFDPRAATVKARDFNWHHVFGLWSALPLVVVVASAVVFSYPWANDLLYRSLGEEPPARRGPSALLAPPTDVELPFSHAARPTLDDLLAIAASRREGWRTITLQLPEKDTAEVRFTLDSGTGGQPQRRDSLVLHRADGQVAEWLPFEALSTGRRARSWVRYLHTGEALGIAGQTIAGVVSLTSILMVWTGLALAYRRLIAPLLRPKPGGGIG